MKKISYLLLSSLFILSFIVFAGCGEDDDEEQDNGDRDFKQDMRDFVGSISTYAKNIDSDFIIIPQNGHELVSHNGDNEGNPEPVYLGAIDALGQEDLFYGYDDDDVATPSEDTEYLTDLLDIAKSQGKVILVTDYCWTHAKMTDSYSKNAAKGYISFAADSRELDIIPDYPTEPNNVNTESVTSISEVRNFLYLINPELFASKSAYINTVTATDYDLLIMDFFFDDTQEWTAAEVGQLRAKANGGSRLIVSYMSIGEAESYRYYWQESWYDNPPEWMAGENPDWPDNYKVKYWVPEWQSIIYGNDNSYIKKILDAGFDGVYLDIIEAFEYFE